MTNQEIIAVIQAHSEGKQIEARSKEYGDWHPANPDWNFDKCDYRVKPTPREWWILPPGNNNKVAVCDYKPPNPDCIHVREILE